MDAFGDGPTAAIDDRLQGGLALSVAYRPAQLPADCSQRSRPGGSRRGSRASDARTG